MKKTSTNKILRRWMGLESMPMIQQVRGHRSFHLHMRR